MPVLQLKHTTTYRYSQPAAIGVYRLMMRPLESHDRRLLPFSLTIDPATSEPCLAIASAVETNNRDDAQNPAGVGRC